MSLPTKLCGACVALAIAAGATFSYAQTPGCDPAVSTTRVGNTLVLLEDMDCTVANGFDGFGLSLADVSALDLAGFTLKADRAVSCNKTTGRCLVFSSVPGGTLLGDAPSGSAFGGGIDTTDGSVRAENLTITGFNACGVYSEYGKVTLEDVVVTGNGDCGVHGFSTKIVRTEISNNGGFGLFSDTRSLVTDSTITGNGGAGITMNDSIGRTLKLTGSTVSGNGAAGVEVPLRATATLRPKVVIRESTIDDNGADGLLVAPERDDGNAVVRDSSISGNQAFGIRGPRKLRAKATTIDGNGAGGIETSGAAGCRVKMRDGSASGNGTFGVNLGVGDAGCVDGKLTVKATTLSGNGLDAICGVTQACADVGSPTEPRLDASSACDTSYISGSGLPGSSWGICTLD